MTGAPLVPFNDLRPGEDGQAVRQAIERVLHRGWFVLGPEVEGFEAEFASASGMRHMVGVANGTDAIALTLRALGIGLGDEVITSPLTAVFTALGIMMAGARPVFADIDPDRLTIDPAAAAAAIGPATAAILPVHLYGQTADMTALSAVAAGRGLAIIEDCCQAHLATCEGRPVGTHGTAGVFSFYPTKNLGALGDGGAVGTNDAALADRIRVLRNGGRTGRDQHAMAGTNSRLDEVQAAILRARLPFLRSWTDRRRRLAAAYRAMLPADALLVPPERDPGHVYHLFPVRSPERDALRAHLTRSGVETLVHYPIPVPRQDALAGERPAACPVADRICGELLSLPLSPQLADDAQRRVVDAAARFQPAAGTAR